MSLIRESAEQGEPCGAMEEIGACLPADVFKVCLLGLLYGYGMEFHGWVLNLYGSEGDGWILIRVL